MRVSVCPGLCPLSLSIVSAPPSSLKKPFLPWPSLGRFRLPSYTAAYPTGKPGSVGKQLHCCLRNPLVPFLQSNLRESRGRKIPTGAQSDVHTDLRVFLLFPFSFSSPPPPPTSLGRSPSSTCSEMSARLSLRQYKLMTGVVW